MNRKSEDEMVKELDRAIKRLEDGRYPTHSAEWCADRIAWMWRFHKLSHEKMVEFADRMSRVFEREARYGF